MSKSKQPDSGSNSSTASLDRQLTEADLKNGDYECIMGDYFTVGGKYVPLSNRPAIITQEKELKDVDTVVDVGMIGKITTVSVTTQENVDQIESILDDIYNAKLISINEDNTTFKESEFVLKFSP
jgi:hypothetical protein